MYKNKKYKQSLNAKKSEHQLKPTIESTSQPLTPINENLIQDQYQPPEKIVRLDVQQQNEIDDDYDLLSSQASVPASQVPTQRRYLSQRGISLARTQSNILKNKSGSNYFEAMLVRAGVIIDDPETYILPCDHVTFVNNFRSTLKKNPDFPNNLTIFLDGFEEAMNSDATLKLLTGCTIQIPNSERSYPSQDSVTVNFLTIEFLQKKIIEILLRHIEKSAHNDHEANFNGIPLLPLLLSQLKYVTTAYGNLIYLEIMKIYEKSTLEGKKTIRENAEFIFDPSNHDDFVKYLIDHAESNRVLLSKTNVKCFTNLYLNFKSQKKICERILNYMKSDPNAQNFSYLVKFLFKANIDDENEIKELVIGIREALDILQCNSEDNYKESLNKIFLYIRQGLIKSKKLFEIWQKFIQNRPENDSRSIDLIIFALMISIREEKSAYIENLIKRQIKLERLTITSLIEAKSKYSPILSLLADTFLHLLNNFLNDKNSIVSGFAKNSYKIIFSIGDDLIQKKILNDIVDISCKKESQLTETALDVLNELTASFNKEIQNYGMLLAPMLEQINGIKLNQARIIMQLLSSIAYPLPHPTEDFSNSLQDHLDMLVKKQINNRSTFVKKQGIIGTIQLVDHICRTENFQSNDIYLTENMFECANDIPEGLGRKSASYITKIFSTCNYCPETLGLFYDELAISFSTKTSKTSNLDRNFLVWMTDITTKYFEENFVTENVESEENCGLDLALFNCLNTSDEIEDSEIDVANLQNIAINIAGRVLKPLPEAHCSIEILCSLFSATVKLHEIRYGGDLSGINAVLGFALVLPKLIGTPEALHIFEDYSEEQSKKILDMHFYVVNWYRTIIGAYCTQNDDKIRKKVIERLSSIIEVEDAIHELLKKAPLNYYPPTPGFLINDSNQFTFKKPVGRGKTPKPQSKSNDPPNFDPNPNTEAMSILAQTQNNNLTLRIKNKVNASNNTYKIKFERIYGPKECFRQIDSDIILLLREEFKLTHITNGPDPVLCLGLMELHFIMTDLVSKIESISGISKLIPDNNEQKLLYVKDFLEKSGNLSKVIFSNMNQIYEEIKAKVEEVDNELGHIDLFTDRMNYLKVTLALCLRFLKGFFSYSGFHDNDDYKIILRKSLQSIIESKSSNLIELSSKLINFLLLLDIGVIDIKSAVHLFQLLKNLNKIAQKESLDKQIRELCKTFLCKKWCSYDGQKEKGAVCNIILDHLIKEFLKNSDFKRLSKMLKILSNEVKMLNKKDSFLKSFPNIHKANFPMLYKELGVILLMNLNKILSEQNSDIQLLKIWEECCENLNYLLDIVKCLEVQRIFLLYIKNGHQFVKIFLQNGLPVLERTLRKNPEICSNLLKNLQNNTRFLHNLCCQSKKNKTTAIINQIPTIRETVEMLLFKVKAALVANKVGCAIWMGNLKNKDIHGKEIFSQDVEEVENDNDNSDDELPGDDESVEETIYSDSEDVIQNEDSLKGANSRSKCF